MKGVQGFYNSNMKGVFFVASKHPTTALEEYIEQLERAQ